MSESFSMDQKTRVLIADDSAFMRKLLTNIIESDPSFTVVKTVRNGLETLKAVKELRPDVITLDIELPEIDGLTCVTYIMEECPTPVVVITGMSELNGEETIRCLEYGAVDMIRKQGGRDRHGLENFKREVLIKLRIAAQVKILKVQSSKQRKQITREETAGAVAMQNPQPAGKIVVIAASSGGPRALSHVIPRLPSSLPAGVLVVQHMPDEFIPAFARRLDHESRLRVKVATDAEQIRDGWVFIAPTRKHVTVRSAKGNRQSMKLLPLGPSENGSSSLLSSADELMLSVAPIYGKRAIAAVLTGMGCDGTEGMRAIRRFGGVTLAEDRSTALVYGMPKSAAEAGVVDRIVPLDQMAEEIVRAIVGQ